MVAIAGSHDFFEQLDGELARLGATIRLGQLTCAGPVFPLPAPDDFPALGWWAPESIAASAPCLKKATGLAARWFGPKLDPELAEALRDVRRWLNAALRTPEDCLIGVQHY
jgi:hypothetical protein